MPVKFTVKIGQNTPANFFLLFCSSNWVLYHKNFVPYYGAIQIIFIPSTIPIKSDLMVVSLN